MSTGIRSTELRHLAAAWASACPMVVREARVPDAGTVLLHGDGRWWRLEVRPFPHMRWQDVPPPNPKRPLSFQGLLRARLPAQLLGVECLGDERRVTLHFSTGTLEAWFFGRGRLVWREDGEAVASTDGPVARDLAPPSQPTASAPPSRLDPDDPWTSANALFPELAAAESARRVAEEAVQLKRRRQTALRRKIDALERDLARAKGATSLRDETDLLAAYAHIVPHGATQAELADLTTGAPRTVQLDPARPIRAQIAARYARAARLSAATADIEGRLTAAREALAADADVSGVARGAKAVPATAKPYWQWAGPRGATIHVSRDRHSATAVLRDAGPRDLWFHLRDRPSPHVVLRLTSRDDDAAVRAAIEVLLATARVPPDVDVVVQRARRCDVRPIKGEPGKVRVDRETTGLWRRAPDALSAWHRQGGSADDQP